MTECLSIPITDASSTGEARRETMKLAEKLGFSTTDIGRASIIATELASNLVKHAVPEPTGIIVCCLDAKLGTLDIFALDSGPGMREAGRCFEDGYSTSGTPGTGLGAVTRLADEIDFFSDPSGTVIWCRLAPKDAAREAQVRAHSLMGGAISLPAPLERVCGDVWRVTRLDDGRMAVMIADGLGHGPIAAEAAEAACKCFDQAPGQSPARLLEAMHSAISGTRGAAVAAACVDAGAGILRYAGVGNIAGSLLSADGASRGLFSHNGTVGHLARKFQDFEYPWRSSDLLIMHSDGVQSRWSLQKFAGLTRRRPAVVAAVVLRAFRRGRDDASVVVVAQAS